MVMHKCYLIGHPDGHKFLQSLSVSEVEEPSFQVESGFAEEPENSEEIKISFQYTVHIMY